MTPIRKVLTLSSLAAFVVALGAAPASARQLLATEVAADGSEYRRCHERPAPGVDGVVTRRVTAPSPGLVSARLTGGGDSDWDVGVFEADSKRSVAGSAGPRTHEVAEGFTNTRELIVQACRLRGDDAAKLEVHSFSTGAADASDGPIQLVRVHTPTRQDKTRLTTLGLDLTEHGGKGFVEVVLYGAQDANALRAANFTWDVRIPDLVALGAANQRANARYAASTERSALPSGRDSYRRLPDYEADMKWLALRNPGLVKLVELDLPSLEGRSITGVEITKDVNDTADGRPVFLQLGVHHAREWPSGEHAMEWAFELVNGYKNGDARTVDLVEKVRTIVVPINNPDGFNLSRESENLDLRLLQEAHPLGIYAVLLGDPAFAYKRRNCRVEDFRKPEPGECGQRTNRNRGVDTNRNYGGLWGGPGASVSPTSDTYRGGTPFSEPEVENVRRLVSSRQVTTLITNHTFSNLVLRPPGVREQGPAPDEEIYRELGKRMTDQNGYANQKGYELYDTTGTTEDWTYPATGGLGFTFEIGPDEFHPPFEEVVAEYRGTRGFEGKGNREAYFVAAENAADTQAHSVVAGTGTPGNVVRASKTFMTSTHDPMFLDDDGAKTSPAVEFEDRLDTKMTIPSSGAFEFHVNPSTRPAVAERTYAKLATEPLRPKQEISNSTPTVAGGGASDQPIYYQERDFEVTELDAAGLVVTIDGGSLDDYDLYVYRELEDGARQFVGSSTTATADEEVVVENPVPGKYVARVLNWLAVDPRWTGSFAVYGPGDVEHRVGQPEYWTVSCETPSGEVLSREKVLVDRGDRATLSSPCEQGSSGGEEPGGSKPGRGGGRPKDHPRGKTK